jgi:hypothetical protein
MEEMEALTLNSLPVSLYARIPEGHQLFTEFIMKILKWFGSVFSTNGHILTSIAVQLENVRARKPGVT